MNHSLTQEFGVAPIRDRGNSESTVLELFERQVEKTPEATAVQFEQRRLTYGELNRLANQFAVALCQQGVVKGDCVGLCIERGPEAIAAMLGTLKVGGIFVPLDPDYPVERLAFMISDAGIGTVITRYRETRPVVELLEQAAESRGAALTWIDCADSRFLELGEDVEAIPPVASDVAYVMYTSGSTGLPKGVVIDHAALTTYCLADIEVYQLVASDRTLQFSTLNFDIAIEEIFPPLLIGSCIVIRPGQRAEAANELSEIIQKYNITAVHLATAYWHAWVDLLVASRSRVPASLRLMIATGEKVSVEHYRRWQNVCAHRVLWCNAYGPTEATVTATVYIPDSRFALAQMPIGKPLPGYEAFILDDDLCPSPPGETGQLMLAGAALAKGYLNRPELTAAAFLMVDLPGRGKLRLYRTGDLARRLPDGNIEFAGRVDHQMKIGSYRIEPGEIEAVLNQHAAVCESLVIHEQVGEQKYLIAYVAVGERQIRLEDLAEHLGRHLPAYMVPSRYHVLQQMPKTVNGKIDRQGLPDPLHSQTAKRDRFQAPRNQLERLLVTLWERTLQIRSIGIHDDFFALGGSSLLVTQVIAGLTGHYAIELPVRDFFANPTIASCARHIASLLDDESQQFASSDSEMALNLPLAQAEFIGSGRPRLFTVWYRPRTTADCPAVRRHAVLICNAWGHEGVRAYRNLQQLAVHLCSLGFDVLRFDYAGMGNSENATGDCIAESMLEDVRQAADHLRAVSDCSRLSVIGIRLGATLAATSQLDSIERLVLWDPIVSGSGFVELLDQFHDYALTSQTRFARRISASVVDQAYGYPMDDRVRQSFSKMKLCESVHWHPAVAHTRCVLSEAYRVEPGDLPEFGSNTTIGQTADQIYWHDPAHAERAFSSPGAFRDIADFLHGDDR